MVYVALLRGINVGGNNRVEMAKLKRTFERMGFLGVKTFIASGNVIFQTDSKDPPELVKKIEKALDDDFGIKVKVLLRDLPSIARLVKSIPAPWVNDKKIKCDVMFLWDGIDNKNVLKRLPFDPAIEDVVYVRGAVLWRIDRSSTPKSRMIKIVGTRLHREMTVRNPNTVRRIYQLMSEADGLGGL